MARHQDQSVENKGGRPRKTKPSCIECCDMCKKGVTRSYERTHFCNVHWCSGVELYALLQLAGWSVDDSTKCIHGNKTQDLDKVQFDAGYWMHTCSAADGVTIDHRPASSDHHQQYTQYLKDGKQFLISINKWDGDEKSQSVMARLDAAVGTHETAATTTATTSTPSAPVDTVPQSVVASAAVDGSDDENTHNNPATAIRSKRRRARSNHSSQQASHPARSSSSRSSLPASSSSSVVNPPPPPSPPLPPSPPPPLPPLSPPLPTRHSKRLRMVAAEINIVHSPAAPPSSSSPIPSELSGNGNELTSNGNTESAPVSNDASVLIGSDGDQDSSSSDINSSNEQIIPDSRYSTHELFYHSKLEIPPSKELGISMTLGINNMSRVLYEAMCKLIKDWKVKNILNSDPAPFTTVDYAISKMYPDNLILGQDTSKKPKPDTPKDNAKPVSDRLLDVAPAVDIRYLLTAMLNEAPGLLSHMRKLPARFDTDTHPNCSEAAKDPVFQPLGRFRRGKYIGNQFVLDPTGNSSRTVYRGHLYKRNGTEQNEEQSGSANRIRYVIMSFVADNVRNGEEYATCRRYLWYPRGQKSDMAATFQDEEQIKVDELVTQYELCYNTDASLINFASKLESYFIGEEEKNVIETVRECIDLRLRLNREVEEYGGKRDGFNIEAVPISPWQDATGAKPNPIELFRISLPFLEREFYTRVSPVVALYNKMNTKLGEATNVAMARSFELAQAGWFAQIGGTLTFVTAPLYVFIADNVAQYHIAGVVSHSSTFNCGHCNVSKDKLNINDLMDDTMPRTRDHQQRAVEAVEKLQNIIDVGQLKPGFRAECKYYNAQELEKMRRRLGGGALDLENVVVRIPIVNCKNKKRGRPAKKSVSHAAASTTSATADRATSSTAASSTISGRAAARVTSTAQPANAIEDDEEEEEEDDADLDSVGEVPAYIREIADEEGNDEDEFDDDDAQTDTGVTQRHSVQSHSSSKLITHDGGDGGRYAGRGATVMNMFLDLLPELRQLFRDFGMSMDDLLHDLRVYGKREMLTYTGVCKLVKFMEANLTGPNTIFANSFSTMPFLGLALDLLHDVHLGMSNVLIKAFNKVNSTGKYHNISMKQAIDELNAEGPKSVREKCGYTKIPQPSGDCLTGKHCATLMLALPFILGKMGRKKYTRLLTIEMRFAMVYRDLILLLGRKRNGTLVNYRNSVEHQLRMVYMELRALAEQKPYTDLIGVTIKTHRLFKHLPELIGKYGGTTYMSSEIFEAGNAAARQARQRFTQSSGDAFSLVRLTRTFLFQLNDVVQHASRIYANAHGQPQPEEQTTGTASSRAPTPTPTPTTTAALANVTNRNDANVDTTVRLEADNLQSQRRITQLESERDAANARADALQTQLEELQRQLLAERAQR